MVHGRSGPRNRAAATSSPKLSAEWRQSTILKMVLCAEWRQLQARCKQRFAELRRFEKQVRGRSATYVRVFTTADDDRSSRSTKLGARHKNVKNLHVWDSCCFEAVHKSTGMAGE